MGTSVSLTVAAKGNRLGERALDAGFAEVARLEGVFSSYRTNSDLARVNRGAGAGVVSVPPEFIELTRRAFAITDLTDGAFNPLVGPAVKLWGIPENPRKPAAAELEGLLPLLEPSWVTVEDTGVGLKAAGMALGFGGIAKGYTADRVADLLASIPGISGAVVAIAGDIRVFGTRPDGSPWRVGVKRPKGGTESILSMTSGAVSTSGNYARFFELDGVRYHHILDPRTLMPSRAVTAVSVTAPDATTTDALATALFVMGADDGLALVTRMDGAEALFILPDGIRRASPGWAGVRPAPG